MLIKQKGFQLKSPGFKFEPVNKINNRYNYDKIVFDASMQGKTVFDLYANSPALVAAGKIVENILELSSS